MTRTIEIPANRPEIFLEVKRRTSDVRAAILPVLMEFKRAHQRGEKRSFKKTIIWPRSMVMMDEVMGIIREVLDDVMSVCFMDAMVINYHAASPAFGKQRILIQLLDPDGDVYILVASPALGTGTDLTSTTLDSHVFYDLVDPHSNRLSVCLSVSLSVLIRLPLEFPRIRSLHDSLVSPHYLFIPIQSSLFQTSCVRSTLAAQDR